MYEDDVVLVKAHLEDVRLELVARLLDPPLVGNGLEDKDQRHAGLERNHRQRQHTVGAERHHHDVEYLRDNLREDIGHMHPRLRNVTQSF